MGTGIYTVLHKDFFKERKIVKVGVLRIADSISIYIVDQEKTFEKYSVKVEVVELGSTSE